MKNYLHIALQYRRHTGPISAFIMYLLCAFPTAANTVTVWEEQFNTNNAQWEFYPNSTGLSIVSQAVPNNVVGAEDGFEGKFTFHTPSSFPGGGIRYAILTIPVPVLAGDKVEYSIRAKSPEADPNLNNYASDRLNLVAPTGGTDFDSGFQNHDTVDGLTYQKEPGTYFDVFDTTLVSNLRTSQNLWLGISGNSVALGHDAIFYIDYIRIVGERTGVPGDYNGNTAVDASDYAVWRKFNGTNTQLLNEVSGTTPGTVTSEDYTAWRNRFGIQAGSGLGATAVPEPASACTGIIAMYLLSFIPRRR